jgi:outer membrane lipoprotein-sorting protein
VPVFFCLLIVVYSFFSTSPCFDILNKTLASVENIKTIKFHLKFSERIKGKLRNSESQIKLSRNPTRAYMFLNGPELLWLEGKNNDNALVNPKGFPYMNLNLDPMGTLMRENQHHTVKEVGYDYFAELIRNAIKISGDNFDSYFKCQGEIELDNHPCYLITAEYPDYKYETYTVKKGETLITIARDKHLSEYMLLELNEKKVSHYDDIKNGQMIVIPNVYGNKIILYIDKELLVPRIIRVYDDKGLFESYEYHDLEINPKIADQEFTKEYKGYGF